MISFKKLCQIFHAIYISPSDIFSLHFAVGFFPLACLTYPIFQLPSLEGPAFCWVLQIVQDLFFSSTWSTSLSKLCFPSEPSGNISFPLNYSIWKIDSLLVSSPLLILKWGSSYQDSIIHPPFKICYCNFAHREHLAMCEDSFDCCHWGRELCYWHPVSKGQRHG